MMPFMVRTTSFRQGEKRGKNPATMPPECRHVFAGGVMELFNKMGESRLVNGPISKSS